MNNVTEKLKAQATEDILGVPVLNAELFAKLIIQSCINVCDKVEDEYLNNEELLNNEKYAIGAAVCCNALHKHFGVN